ncbi:phosphate signaling complex PhoU family protein [Pseudonocardia broussonetiae]|uniref:Phosphate transport system regulatory protein PhoU n=1 Tax=Pseudonocardia broussonetiae TaxID=2736640 RepID=A0A6M6JN69_9PSEU|nr:PhoU domain-containing protein [Pseudonocardia broussonetiae]QJY48795.1 phosphate transport system regulatory protein PhoU [Pseudonocardia broussonetiae]
MREELRRELDGLGAHLALMCGCAGSSMERAVRAVLRADLPLAEAVIGEEAHMEHLRAEGAGCAHRLLMLQAPVARDLRRVVTAMQAGERIARMGGLASHVAGVARRRHPDRALPAELAAPFAEMAALAVGLARRVGDGCAAPLQEQWAERERDDDRVDALHRDLLATVRRPEAGYDVRTGVDVALLTRFVERFADQAVSVARRLDDVVAVRAGGVRG